MKLFALTSLLMLVSCASTMPGHDVKSNHKTITATFEENLDFSTERTHMLQFSIMNKTDKWVEFTGANINSTETLEVLVGNKINAWIEACTLEKQVSDYNRDLLLGSLAVGGAVVAGSSGHQRTSTVGAAIALGSITVIGANEMMNSKNKAELIEALPEKHIFRPFVVPPHKVIQRWILIEGPAGAPLDLTLNMKDGDKVLLKVRAPKTM
jgi:hypothetical protein